MRKVFDVLNQTLTCFIMVWVAFAQAKMMPLKILNFIYCQVIEFEIFVIVHPSSPLQIQQVVYLFDVFLTLRFLKFSQHR